MTKQCSACLHWKALANGKFGDCKIVGHCTAYTALCFDFVDKKSVH